jgi:GNAT superfamily N-acetyltransferase
VRIASIADHPALVELIARWHWEEWGHADPDGSLAAWTESLRCRARRDGIPTTFVALDADRLLGSVTLVEHDMAGHASYGDLGPWVAGTFVRPDARGRGVGAGLMRHAASEAARWGISRLHLYTESARGFYERLGWQTIDETEWEGGVVSVMTLETALPLSAQVSGSRRLSQRISEGDGISIIVCVEDAGAARAAEAQGAEAVAVAVEIDGIRDATTLPLLWIGSGAPADADAVRIRPDEEPRHDGPESVVDVRDDEELELALERLDPEIFLLNAHDIDEDVDPLDAVLELLPDVPAGKLAIAQVEVGSRDEVLALERAGVDAVLVRSRHVGDLVGDRPVSV